MNIAEQIALRGELSITLHRAGQQPQTITEHNMIMTAAKSALARLIAGHGSGKNINRIAFGTNGMGQRQTTKPSAGHTPRPSPPSPFRQRGKCASPSPWARAKLMASTFASWGCSALTKLYSPAKCAG